MVRGKRYKRIDVAEPGGFPRRFDQYVLLKPLARGGMGELYLAVSGSRGMEKLCVIKTVLPNLVTVDNAKRFRDEAMVVVKLQHGNLVPVFDAGRHEKQVYIAMEYVDGKDLLAVWNRCAQKRVPFPIDVAVYIVKELARGLAYAHAFGGLKLVHRDVSPANVLLSYTGEVKLTDFGLARSTLKLQQTAPGIIFGKLSYLAPEQARSEPLDGRTDLYAAGILLWELLTGQQLFPVKAAPAGDEGARRDSTADALARVRDPRVPLPSHVTPRVPPELDAIVMRALAREPAKRYQTGEELRADLAAFLAATTPQTDAARLASFLRPLFHEVAESERAERERLVRDAAGLLSGAFSAEMAAPAAAPRSPAGADPPTAPAEPVRPAGQSPRTVGRRHTDTAPHEGDAPGGRRAAAVTPHGHGGGDSGEGRLSDDPRVGTTLGGRYLIERLCGEGAMGRVYEARHVDIGRRMAIKILHSSFRHSAEVVERFRREARAASKIGHPNIVDVTDSGTTPDGAFFFVMEYLDGVDLEQLIEREGALDVERALLITTQLTRALQAAHSSEIIHRDLKPANVMLINRKDDDDFVKVLDFGISRNMDLEGSGDDVPGSARRGLTRPDVAVGTPVYMSPEQAAGMRADALTDVYAVGGLLYEMLTATPPCTGDDVLTVLNKKATEDPVPIGKLRPELPEDVQALVMRALSRRPKDRQPSMSALKDEVLRCLATLQGAAAHAAAELRPSPSEETRQRRSTERTRTMRVRPWMIGASVGGLVGLMALVSVVRRSGETPPPERALAAAEPVTAPPTAAMATPAPENAPFVVAVEPPRATTPPPQEPVNLKRAARVIEPPSERDADGARARGAVARGVSARVPARGGRSEPRAPHERRARRGQPRGARVQGSAERAESRGRRGDAARHRPHRRPPRRPPPRRRRPRRRRPSPSSPAARPPSTAATTPRPSAARRKRWPSAPPSPATSSSPTRTTTSSATPTLSASTRPPSPSSPRTPSRAVAASSRPPRPPPPTPLASNRSVRAHLRSDAYVSEVNRERVGVQRSRLSAAEVRPQGSPIQTGATAEFAARGIRLWIATRPNRSAWPMTGHDKPHRPAVLHPFFNHRPHRRLRHRLRRGSPTVDVRTGRRDLDLLSSPEAHRRRHRRRSGGRRIRARARPCRRRQRGSHTPRTRAARRARRRVRHEHELRVGYCADGVCCDIACTGACVSCNLGGLAGLCSPVKDAPDPGTCDGSQICGPERTCGQPEHEACATDASCAYGACRTYFLDNDGDGYGTAPISRCDREPAPPPGYALRGGDCCDTDANVYPGELTFYWTPSACGTFDYNCDGTKEPENHDCQNGCGVACLHSVSTIVQTIVPPTACR